MVVKIKTAFLVLLALPAAAIAATPAVPFLKFGSGARAQGMAGAFGAVAEGAAAVGWNPSQLSRRGPRELMLYHNRFISDYQFAYAAYAQPPASRSAGWGAAFGHLYKGRYEGRNESRGKTEDFGASDSFLSLAFGRSWGNNLSLGGAFDVIHSRIQSYSATTFAADLAASYQADGRWRAMIGLFHLGPGMKFENESSPLPTEVAVGLGSWPLPSLTLSTELRYGVVEKQASVAFGGEWLFAQILALRAGFKPSELDRKKGEGNAMTWRNLDGLRMGGGIRFFSRARLDYAFTPMGELGSTHQTSLSFEF